MPPLPPLLERAALHPLSRCIHHLLSVQVLASVHGRGMVHCDIKPSNFCLRTAVTVPSPGCGMVLPGQALSVERGSPPNPFAGNVRIIDVGTAQDLPQQEVQVELPEQRKCAQERVRGIHRRACAQPLAARNRSRVGAGTWAGAPSRLSARVGTPAFMAPEVGGVRMRGWMWLKVWGNEWLHVWLAVSC